MEVYKDEVAVWFVVDLHAVADLFRPRDRFVSSEYLCHGDIGAHALRTLL